VGGRGQKKEDEAMSTKEAEQKILEQSVENRKKKESEVQVAATQPAPEESILETQW
jgi:RNase H-fold protein (predicted Holliday junction resolvase)